jgi:acyl-CoA synthetase (AMP-forming)/AMP-acid ligase II
LNERNELAAAGERGELCVRGSALAHGYWNDPDKTAAAFVQNPLNPHYPERIYRTGDIVYRNERGEIMYAGRRDNQVKHLGYRIELGEIESAAMTLPEIRSVCVLYDAAGSRIAMFYEAAAAVGPVGVRTALLTRLPKYMVPSLIRQLDEMPLNSSGKIDRGKLAAGLKT